jgi:hypothetical protein
MPHPSNPGNAPKLSVTVAAEVTRFISDLVQGHEYSLQSSDVKRPEMLAHSNKAKHTSQAKPNKFPPSSGTCAAKGDILENLVVTAEE